MSSVNFDSFSSAGSNYERENINVDIAIVGAGLAGLYMLHKMRNLGFSVTVLEEGENVGGTWYWNCYPGARCDVPSMDYSYSFSDELQNDWEWTERYPSQPEILRYINHVADRFELRSNIQFSTRVTSSIYDESKKMWIVRTANGQKISAKFCIMATGCLSAPQLPDIEGANKFKGRKLHTARWPREGVDLTDLRVGVIGTGSSGIQLIPSLANQVKQLYVFQRTANFSIPANNGPIDPEQVRKIKDSYADYREASRLSYTGVGSVEINQQSALKVTQEERNAKFERRWNQGGLSYLASFADLLVNRDANQLAAEFVAEKIRGLVSDPEIADQLIPCDYPIGSKRLCVDTNYYDTFNKSNVTLVNVKKTPIVAFSETGIVTENQSYDLDAVVFATGFDAMTGALLNIDIQGRNGITLKKKWSEGPRAYLGLMTSEFPNLFFITGPGSPSVLSMNMIVCIEQHVDWIADCIQFMRKSSKDIIEASKEAENSWAEHVNVWANHTIYPLGNSWYSGANVPGKPRVFMPYVGGVGNYRAKCNEVASKGYDGFIFESENNIH